MKQIKSRIFAALTLALGSACIANAQVEIPVLDYTYGVGPATGQAQPMATFVPIQGNYIAHRARSGGGVQLNWAMLDTLDPSVQARITLPDAYGQHWEVVLTQSSYREQDDYDWIGQIAGRPNSDVLLARYKDGFHAMIRDYSSGESWSIEGDSSGRFYVLKGDGVFETLGPVCDPNSSRIENAPINHSGSVGTRGGVSTVSDPLYTVDIMTVATQQVLQNLGASNFVSICRVAVNDFNLRSFNSRVIPMSPGYVTLRLVAVDTVSGQDYSEIPANQSDGAADPDFGGSFELNQLGSGTSPLSTEISALRMECKADLVAVCRWSPWLSQPGGSASVGGVAFRPSNQTSLDGGGFIWSVNSMNHSSLNFVGDIFPHEVGHCMALVHDPAQYLEDIGWDLGDPIPGPASALSSRPHGYKNSCELGCVIDDIHYHTTMAYGIGSACGRSTLAPLFSSPQYTFDPGAFCTSSPVGDTGVSWASELMLISADDISQYNIGASLRWVAPGANGPGTYLDPLGSIVTAVNEVQGEVGEAKVRIRSGDYNVSGSIILNNAATLSAEGGSVVIR